jgi:hypothetical protein
MEDRESEGRELRHPNEMLQRASAHFAPAER